MKRILAGGFLVFVLPVMGQGLRWVHGITGNGADSVKAVAGGPDGSVYVAGVTNSADFAVTAGAARGVADVVAYNRNEVYLRRISADGGAVMFSTFVGTAREGRRVALAVDRGGNAYLAYRGEDGVKGLEPRVLETGGALQVVKIAADGRSFGYRVAVLPDAFYGPPVGIVVSEGGAVTVAAGERSVGVRRIDAAGSSVEARADVHCEGQLKVTALAAGVEGQVYVGGTAECAGFPATPGALATAMKPGGPDGFVMRFKPELGEPEYATLLGGGPGLEVEGLAAAEYGEVVVAGRAGVYGDALPLDATPLQMTAPQKYQSYGLVARLSADGTRLKGAALLPAPQLTSVALDGPGNVWAAGTSQAGAMVVSLTADLRKLRWAMEPPAAGVAAALLAKAGERLVFGVEALAMELPSPDPAVATLTGANAFVGVLTDEAAGAELELRVKTLPQMPEVWNSTSRCQYSVTNRGPAEARGVLLRADGAGGGFVEWQADGGQWNVPAFWTGVSGPRRAVVERLAPGESTTIELIGNTMVWNAVSCWGRVYSAAWETELGDNEASDVVGLKWINVTVNTPRGVRYRRDEWPVLLGGESAYPMQATANSKMTITIASPQKTEMGFTYTFQRWSDGSTENPRTFTLGDKDALLTPVFDLKFSEVTPAAVAPPAQMGEPVLKLSPYELAAGTETREVVISGTGFSAGHEVLWNGAARATEYLNPYQLKMTLEPDDVRLPGLNWVSVRNRETGEEVRGRQAMFVYLAMRNNAVLEDVRRERVWVASPEQAGVSSHEAVLLDGKSGEVEARVWLPAEPQALALTEDSRYLYVASPGRVLRVDLETKELNLAFDIPVPMTGTLAEASAMLAAPGRPERLLLSVRKPFNSPSYGGTILFANGVEEGPRLSGYDGPQWLYGWLDERTVVGGDEQGSLYWLEVGAGVKLKRTLTKVTGVGSCRMDAGLLYCESGLVVDAASGSYVRQYAARGAVAALPGKDRVAFLDMGMQVNYGGPPFGPLVVLEQASGRLNWAGLLPLSGRPGSFVRIGPERLIYREVRQGEPVRTAGKLYVFELP